MSVRSVCQDVPENIDRFVDAARERLGDHLQAVVHGDTEHEEYTLAYTQSAFCERYEIEDATDIVEEHTLEWIEVPYQESLHPTLGDLEVTIRIYEDGVNVHGWRWDGESSIVIVYLDDDVSDIPWIVEQIEGLDETDG
ncbi:hypothetical protein GCM10009066_03200 [Halarchaeum salinum]|uniref:Uncharacterized protein n=1 Tax=Halarchaeum salinum TaxID=489912 RepID=A0AAV3S4K5_9EURY